VLDLVCWLRNVSNQLVSIRSHGEEELYGLYLCGPGALNVPFHIRQTAWVFDRNGPRPEVRIVSLAPGESYDFAVGRSEDEDEQSYWLLPGACTVHGHVLVRVSPPPPGTRAEDDGFAYAQLRCAPVRVRVTAQE
jgi:hypothetical protein